MEEMKRFNPMDYPEYGRHITDGDYRVITCSDWLPPDFEDVVALIAKTGDLRSVYYAPVYECFFNSNGGAKIELAEVEYWLKRVG